MCWHCGSDIEAQKVLQNALAAATCIGLISLAEAVIENGVKDTQTYFGTALICAIKRDEVELTVLLLATGSELSREALQQAALNGASSPSQEQRLDIIGLPTCT